VKGKSFLCEVGPLLIIMHAELDLVLRCS
jgi:hypothetical protein